MGLLTRRQHGQYLFETMPDPAKIANGMRGEGQRRLVLCVHGFHAQLLARSRNGESFFVEQSLDANQGFYILATVHALSGAALDRLQLWKFRFPETQHVRRQLAECGHFADPEIKFFRNDDFIFRRQFGFRL